MSKMPPMITLNERETDYLFEVFDLFEQAFPDFLDEWPDGLASNLSITTKMRNIAAWHRQNPAGEKVSQSKKVAGWAMGSNLIYCAQCDKTQASHQCDGGDPGCLHCDGCGGIVQEPQT